MIITKQNARGGPAIKGFPFGTDNDGQFGYKIGYCSCGCNEALILPLGETREVANKFAWDIQRLDKGLNMAEEIKPKVLVKHRLIKWLGGKVD